ncbi:purine nucleosidase [Quadrisphaera granulorum]|uniref:Purine nucleosidase n=1 Tax=Quadrisphaera granulorum TaxID=317664 RepID=A0A315ZPM8_9ACTN|nr:nucleoside hydrolase [Quadrisphaera granulorum]PWJ47476.1 purine nucleosidase [Quadrisphaera granulorum]SZE98777.1 purine nucleosidase [Quadrisphaera granulorum]
MPEVPDAQTVQTTQSVQTTQNTETRSVPLFLDCDTGVDDALAIAWLAAAPGVDLVGVGAVSGNIAAATGARNTLDLLAMLGLPDVPVHLGAHDFLDHPFTGGAPHVHGADGTGGVPLPRAATELSGVHAAQALVDAAHEHAGELRVLAIGPLTNVALALEIDPDLPRLVRELTIMGGAAMAPGNVTPVAEANIHNDPLAAARVVEAGFDLMVIGLDVTMHQRFEEEHRQALLAAGTPVTRVLGEVLEFYYAFYAQRFGRPCSVLHDPLAAAVATGDVVPSLAPRVPVVVDSTEGPGRGQTIADLRGLYHGFPDSPPVGPGVARVALEIDGDFGAVLLERLLTL